MYEFDSETLKQTCNPVDPDEDVSEIVQGMFEIIDTQNGLGLAANQVGHVKQIIVVKCGEFREVIINPKIQRKWGGLDIGTESCLSMPNIFVKLKRFKRVDVSGLDENRKPVTYKTKGLLARVMQHEIDHMTGITIFDRKKIGVFA